MEWPDKYSEEYKAIQKGIMIEREYQEILKRNKNEEKKEKYGLGFGENLTPTELDIFMYNVDKFIKKFTLIGIILAASAFGGIKISDNYLKKNNPQKYEIAQEKRKIKYEQYLEKQRQDSIYQIKADSLKKIFENKLEKGVK